MNIKQLLAEQKYLISQVSDTQAPLLTSHDYRTWLAESLGRTQSFLIAHDEYELSETELLDYQNGLEKLQQGMPLAYVTGHQPFYLLDFIVNQHTLIPRADTQVLLDTVFEFYQEQLKQAAFSKVIPIRVLDLGTGSGCVAISIAHYFQSKQQAYHMLSTDVSADALQVAQHNAVLNKVKIEWLQGDWFSPISSSQKFDIILSNPPYIDPQDPHLAALRDEPITALVADNHGLADIFHIVDNAKNYLLSGGLLAIEHGYDQGEAVRNYFNQQGFYQVVTKKDYGNNDRVTSGVWQGY